MFSEDSSTLSTPLCFAMATNLSVDFQVATVRDKLLNKGEEVFGKIDKLVPREDFIFSLFQTR